MSFSLQKLLPFAHLPALAETVTQAQTTPRGARILATINCRLPFAQPSFILTSLTSLLPQNCGSLAQLEISERYGAGWTESFQGSFHPQPGLGSLTLSGNKCWRPRGRPRKHIQPLSTLLCHGRGGLSKQGRDRVG